jgi:hypothetical protein
MEAGDEPNVALNYKLFKFCGFMMQTAELKKKKQTLQT